MIRVLIAFLFLPCTVFATIAVTNRGASGDNTPGTTVSLTGRTGTFAAGSIGILVFAADNANGATNNLSATSYTDSVGNIWYVKTQGSGAAIANGASDLTVFTAQIVTAFSATDTLSIGLAVSTTAKAWAFVEAAPDSGNVVLPVASIVSANSSNTTLASNGATLNLEPSTNDLVVGFGSSESGNTFTPDDTDTLNGSWTASQSGAIGSSTSGMSVITQTKIVTGYGGQVFNMTVSGATDIRVGQIVLSEANNKARALGGNLTATQTTTTVTVALPMVTGSAGVLWFSADNNGTSGAAPNFPTSITDSKSNTWTRQQNAAQNPVAAGSGAEYAIYTSILTADLLVNDTIACTYTVAGVTAKGFGLWEFRPTNTGPMTYVSGASGSGAATASPSVTTSSITNGDYVVGVCAAEGPSSASTGFTQDSGTTNGTWMKSQITQHNSTGAPAMSGISQWKQVTATATQVYNPTFGTSADSIIGWVSLHDASTIGPTAQQKAAFFMLFP